MKYRLYPLLLGLMMEITPVVYGTMEIYSERKEIVSLINICFGMIIILMLVSQLFEKGKTKFPLPGSMSFHALYAFSLFFKPHHYSEASFFSWTALCYIYILYRNITGKHLFLGCIMWGEHMQHV